MLPHVSLPLTASGVPLMMKLFTSRAVAVGAACMIKKALLSPENARCSEIVKDGVAPDTWNCVLTRVLIGNTRRFPLKICCEKVL